MKNEKNEGCPSCASVAMAEPAVGGDEIKRLSHWPIQIKLIGTIAPFLNNADLLVAADCTAFATPYFHSEFLKDHKVLIGCPKLDDVDSYRQKLGQIFAQNDIRSVRVLFMEVPCCYGMVRAVEQALAEAKKDIPLVLTQIGIRGAIEDQE